MNALVHKLVERNVVFCGKLIKLVRYRFRETNGLCDLIVPFCNSEHDFRLIHQTVLLQAGEVLRIRLHCHLRKRIFSDSYIIAHLHQIVQYFYTFFIKINAAAPAADIIIVFSPCVRLVPVSCRGAVRFLPVSVPDNNAVPATVGQQEQELP